MNARSTSTHIIGAACIAIGTIGCGEEPAEPSAATTITEALNSNQGCPAGYPGTALQFDQFSSRCSGTADWDHTGIISPRVFSTNDDSFYYAAECDTSASHHYIVGISARTDAARAHSAKCATTPHQVGAPTSRHYLSRANSLLQPISDPTSTEVSGNWLHAGEVRAECLHHEVVTGIAQLESGEIDAISCNYTQVPTGVSTGPNVPVTCQRLDFNFQNHCTQGCSGGSDWAFGYYKNTCGTNQYIKAVAKKLSDGTIAAILCCNF